MKIVILGCGAMGSVYAGLFCEAGHDVIAVDQWAEHIGAINREGLRLSGYSGDRIIYGIMATTQISEALPADLIILATKADGVASAARALRPHLGDNTPVLTMQNGIGAVDILAEAIPQSNIMVGIAKGFGASVPAPGSAHHHFMAEIRIGESAGGESPRAHAVAKVWQEAGFTANVYPDIQQLIWDKFVGNVTLSAPCTVFDVTVRELRERSDLWKIALSCGLEAYAVGKAMGVEFSFNDPKAFLLDYTEGVLDARPSMDHDHKSRRRSEIDFINGRVPILAEKVGLSAPYNETLSAVIRDRERQF